MLIIRTDGNREIGSGHIMRCASIASEMQKLGEEILFVVSDAQSASLIDAIGFSEEIIGGNSQSFSADDGAALEQLAKGREATAILVDSYAVCDSFFAPLSGKIAVTYLDDAYTFTNGILDAPKKWDVARVVNYGFGCSEANYRVVYGSNGTDLLIGPVYAPVRKEFVDQDYSAAASIRHILVTSGGTSPEQALERMVQGCLGALPDVCIDVLVGRMADFDNSAFRNANLVIHNDVQDMASLMLSADLAVCAAGSTLYELCCMGVPTIALPIAENQLPNAQGFVQRGLGLAIDALDWTATDVAEMVKRMKNKDFRQQLSERARSEVDGLGARRIAQALANLVESSISLPEFR